MLYLSNAIQAFLLEQQIRNNSKKTIEYYDACLSKFMAYVEDMPLEQVTPQLCKQYILSLRDRQLSTTSQQTYVRGVRVFLSWCYQEKYMGEDISLLFRLPKAVKPVVDVLSADEILRLMSCFDRTTMIGQRDMCMVSLMLDSGLRLNEVVTMTWDHVRLNDGYIIVLGKGNKERMVPVGLSMRKMLSRYLSYFPLPLKIGDGVPLFRKGDMTPVTQAAIKKLFVRLKDKAKIPRLHPHLLRHTFATRYLENGGDINSLQLILGHTSLEMVKKYVHMNNARMAVNSRSFGPLDNLPRR